MANQGSLFRQPKLTDLQKTLFAAKQIAVVVPCYNEELQITKVVDSIPDFIKKIVIVDDRSKDKTISVVESLMKDETERIVLLKHEVNQGVGGAIATGYKWCAENGIDAAVVMAGDAQMDPEDMPGLLEPVLLDEVDYAKGNRFLFGNSIKNIPFVRLFGNSVLSFLTKIASGYYHVADSQTGYTAINAKALKLIDWDAMYKRYGMPNDILVRLNVGNFRVRDVVIKPVYHVGEQSKMNVKKVVFTISWLLVKLFFWRMKEKYIVRDFHPLVLFYLLGFMMSALGGVFFIRTIYLWNILGYVPEISFLTFMFCTTLGLFSLFFGMLFDMESNKHLR